MENKEQNKKEAVGVPVVALTESTSSVELVQNSKGVNIGIKVYDRDPEIAAQKASKIFNDLNKQYKVE